MKLRQLVIDGQVLKFCRICWSDAELARVYPELVSRFELSHGICDEHFNYLYLQAWTTTTTYDDSHRSKTN